MTEKLGEPRLDVESCESTQLLVDTSLPEGALVVADHQTAGRGRLGRSWEAPAGTALLFSVLLKPPPDRHAPELSLVAGIAVADALERTLGLSVQIKWPNDVMLRRQKVAGCLAEARDDAVVLGIGVNVEPDEGASSRRTPAPSARSPGAAGTARSSWRRCSTISAAATRSGAPAGSTPCTTGSARATSSAAAGSP